MRKNKKKIIIVSVIITLILLIVGVILFVFLKKEDKQLKKQYGIIDIKKIAEGNIDVYSNFYIKDTGKGINVYDLDNNLLFEVNEENIEYETIGSKHLMVTSGDKTQIMDLKGQVLEESIHTKPITYIKYKNTESNNVKIINEETKYLIINDKLYDEDMNHLFTLDKKMASNISNYGNFILSNNILELNGTKNMIINIETNEVLYDDIAFAFTYEDYIAVMKNNIDIINNTTGKLYGTYKKTDGNGIWFSNDSEKVFFIHGKLYTDSSYKLSNGNYVDYSACGEGGKLKDAKGNLVIDDCYDLYEEYFPGIIMASREYKYGLFIDGKKVSDDYYDKRGEYLVKESLEDFGHEIEVLTNNGKKIDVDKTIFNISDNLYIGVTDDAEYLLDESLKEIKGPFDEINCNANMWCIAKYDGLYSLYYKDELILKDYPNIKINNNEIVANKLFETYILKLGTGNILDFKDEDSDIYKTIDINKIINDYNLEHEKDKIENNKDLFQAYAYVTLNNDKLLNYKNYFLDMFEVVVDNKNHLDETVFLYNLENLKIVEVDKINEHAAGTYQNGIITLGEKTDRVIYHEIMHFIDFEINEKKEKNIYECNGKYDFTKTDKSCNLLYVPNSSILVEAGAEAFTAKYFLHDVTAYNAGVSIFGMLEYLFGSKTMQNIYFDNNSNTLLMKLFLDNGITFKEYENFISETNSITSAYIEFSAKTFMKQIDFMIGMYEKVKGGDWTKDEVFVRMLESILTRYVGDIENYSAYKDELIKIKNSNRLKNLIVDSFANKYVFYNPDFYFINDELYFSFDAMYDSKELGNTDDFVYGNLEVIYDYENKKVNTSSFFPREEL